MGFPSRGRTSRRSWPRATSRVKVHGYRKLPDGRRKQGFGGVERDYAPHVGGKHGLTSSFERKISKEKEEVLPWRSMNLKISEGSPGQEKV